MLYFLGLNGPPGSGKDTLAQALMDDEWFQSRFHMVHEKFARPLKETVHFFTQNHYDESVKDLPSPYGPTWRELYIGFSEKFVKPFFGEEIFGTLLLARMKHYQSIGFDEAKPLLVIVSDCGFPAEQNPIQKALPMHNCAWVRLRRNGTSYKGDSRDYLYLENGWMGDYENNKPLHESIPDFIDSVRQITYRLAWTYVAKLDLGEPT